MAIKPSESSKGGGDASKNEMKSPVKIAFVWINHGMSQCLLVNLVQPKKEEENEEKIWSVDLYCNFGNLLAFG